MKPSIHLSSRPSTRLLQLGTGTLQRATPSSRTRAAAIHSSAPDPASVNPFHVSGPPPGPPQPAAEHPYAKIERRRKQAELLKKAKDLRNASDSGAAKGKSPLRKRFWDNAHVKEIDGVYSSPYLLCPYTLIPR